MDLLIIIFAFLLAYGIFVLIAVKLARLFFPKIVDDDGMDLKPQKRSSTPSEKSNDLELSHVTKKPKASTHRQAFFVCYWTPNTPPQCGNFSTFLALINGSIIYN